MSDYKLLEELRYLYNTIHMLAHRKQCVEWRQSVCKIAWGILIPALVILMTILPSDTWSAKCGLAVGILTSVVPIVMVELELQKSLKRIAPPIMLLSRRLDYLVTQMHEDDFGKSVESQTFEQEYIKLLLHSFHVVD